jgi:hypothetical protein
VRAASCNYLSDILTSDSLTSCNADDNAAGTSSGLKRITTSTAPKYFCILYLICLCSLIYSRNLCYIEHFNTIGPLTPAAFEAYWKNLDKDEKKVWVPLPPSRQFYVIITFLILEMDNA